MKEFEVILCIVNKGFADRAMDAARVAGAKGGTILHGRGTASPDAEKLFGITIQPEKEIVMILVAVKIKDAVLKALYDAVGTGTDARGIAFTMPVDETVGLSVKESLGATASVKTDKTEKSEKTEKPEKPENPDGAN